MRKPKASDAPQHAVFIDRLPNDLEEHDRPARKRENEQAYFQSIARSGKFSRFAGVSNFVMRACCWIVIRNMDQQQAEKLRPQRPRRAGRSVAAETFTPPTHFKPKLRCTV